MSPEVAEWHPSAVVITCEHAGNEIPAEFGPLFADAGAELASHRGWDPGAMGYATRVATVLAAPLIATRVSRLLVEVNRSPGHPEVFSRFTRETDEDTRRCLIDRFYTPHHRCVREVIGSLIAADHRVLHLGMHSFTDTLDGVERRVDIGLLFDPDRAGECSFVSRWLATLARRAPDLRVRTNEPYLGTDDGLTTVLRTEFAPDRYAGIEVEVRQGLLAGEGEQHTIGDLLAASMPPVVRG